MYTYLPPQLLHPWYDGGSDIWQLHAQRPSHSSSSPWLAALVSLCGCFRRQNALHTPGGVEDTWHNLFLPQDEEESSNKINLCVHVREMI